MSTESAAAGNRVAVPVGLLPAACRGPAPFDTEVQLPFDCDPSSESNDRPPVAVSPGFSPLLAANSPVAARADTSDELCENTVS